MSDSTLGTVVFAILLACGINSVFWGSYNLYHLLFYLRTRGRKAKGGQLPPLDDCEKQTEEELRGEGEEPAKANMRKATAEDSDDSNDATLATMCDTSSSSNVDTESEQQGGWWTPNPNIEYPMVTIQATAYNEISCIEGLLRNLAKMYWPKDKLQIQLLDDSTLQEAVDLANKVIADIEAKTGITIEHRQRENRIGYKAGNLLHHFPSIRGKYVAIFDADFLPKPEFLLQTIPHFYNDNGQAQEDICLVQATLDHFNQTDNLFTQVQGLLQNSHFCIQQNVRFRCTGFIPFNGTAGVWKTEAIEKSGNWAYDTVTEDLDMACRAKLHGYRFVFLEHVTVPSELPPTMMAYRRQQRRWTQGHMQVGKKLIQAIWRCPDFPLRLKVDVTHCCFCKIDWVFYFLAILISPLWGFSDWTMQQMTIILAVGLYATIIWFWVFFVTLWDKIFSHPDMTFWERMGRLYLVPPFIALQIGMALWQFTSMVEGLIQNDIPFATTPKKGKNHVVDEDALERMVEIDEEENANDQENCKDEYKEFHYNGWDAAALEGMETKVKRRRPGFLSKTFPQWAHFVEIGLAFYLLLTGIFYENKLWAIPLMCMSIGFFWVSIPGIRTSLHKWWKQSTTTLKKKTDGKKNSKGGSADIIPPTAEFSDGSLQNTSSTAMKAAAVKNQETA